MKSAEIYLAGGCFWGLQKYMNTEVKGIISTEVGYSNGWSETTGYNDLYHTGFSETVKISYDADLISLSELLKEFYYTIDPTTLNRQGADFGTQYRTGIYYINETDKPIIEKSLVQLQKEYSEHIVVECKPLLKYIKAEEYHQNYLSKNPNGYCHINLDKIRKLKSAIINADLYRRKSRIELENSLTPIQYAVTQEHKTEEPFNNEYCDFDSDGIYVDVTTGEPLFSSKNKFDAGTGYPSFTKPIDPNAIIETPDVFDDDLNIEALSRVGKAHLGHVFYDMPNEEKRYSINSAALRFIPTAKMANEGYGYLL